jgi:ATP-dependent RNA helicase DeaD
MELPSVEAINDVRIAKFKQQIADTVEAGGLDLFQRLIEDFEQSSNLPAIEIAAALAKLYRGDVPLLLEAPKHAPRPAFEKPAFDKPSFDRKPREFDRGERPERGEREERGPRIERPAFPKKERVARPADAGMDTFRIEVGYDHGVKPGNIVGAVANEAGLDSKNIGRIEIFEDHSLIDLPSGMPVDVMTHLKTVWCAGQQLRITRDGETPDTAGKKSFSGKKPFAGKSNADGKRSFGDKPPFKGKRDFKDSPFGAGKPKPKPHRKGPASE